MSTKPTKNLIIGCTGSVATIKLPLLIKLLLDSETPYKFVIKIIVTERAKNFFDSKDIPLGIQIFTDEDEWKMWNKRGDPVLHIDLGKWADILVMAPLDANSLAKMASGICDNLLMCTARAWDLQMKPLIFCPAMNTRMLEHPITMEQIEKLKNWGLREVPCISKTLMCGDTGNGAMAEVQSIYQEIINSLSASLPPQNLLPPLLLQQPQPQQQQQQQLPSSLSSSPTTLLPTTDPPQSVSTSTPVSSSMSFASSPS